MMPEYDRMSRTENPNYKKPTYSYSYAPSKTSREDDDGANGNDGVRGNMSGRYIEQIGPQWRARSGVRTKTDRTSVLSPFLNATAGADAYIEKPINADAYAEAGAPSRDQFLDELLRQRQQYQPPDWNMGNRKTIYGLDNPIPAWNRTDYVNPSNPQTTGLGVDMMAPLLSLLNGMGDNKGPVVSTGSNDQFGITGKMTRAEMEADRMAQPVDNNPITGFAKPITDNGRNVETFIGRPGESYQDIKQYGVGNPNVRPEDVSKIMGNPPATAAPPAPAVAPPAPSQTGMGQPYADYLGSVGSGVATQSPAAGDKSAIIKQSLLDNGVDPKLVDQIVSQISQTGGGAGYDATGAKINPWEQVQDPVTGVKHPRGYSAEEILNSGAGNLEKGFDYTNNLIGSRGATVTLPDGTVLPQIAGYYISNGRYYPIDLKAAGSYLKRYYGGSGGRGGGGGGYSGRGADGYLANWDIGI